MAITKSTLFPQAGGTALATDWVDVFGGSEGLVTVEAEVGKGYLCDMTDGSVTVNLPEDAEEDDEVIIVNSVPSETNTLTVVGGDVDIAGQGDEIVFDLTNTALKFVMRTAGWSIIASGVAIAPIVAEASPDTPDKPGTDGAYNLTVASGVASWTSTPELPSTDGSYALTVDGVNLTWEEVTAGKPKAAGNKTVAIVPGSKTLPQAFAELDAFDYEGVYSGTITVPTGYSFTAADQLILRGRRDIGWLNISSDQFPTAHTAAAPTTVDAYSGLRALMFFDRCTISQVRCSVDMSALSGTTYIPLALVDSSVIVVGDSLGLVEAILLGGTNGSSPTNGFYGFMGSAMLILLQTNRALLNMMSFGFANIEAGSYTSCNFSVVRCSGTVTIHACDSNSLALYDSVVNYYPVGQTTIDIDDGSSIVYLYDSGLPFWGWTTDGVFRIRDACLQARIDFTLATAATYQPQVVGAALVSTPNCQGTEVFIIEAPTLDDSVAGELGYLVNGSLGSNLTVHVGSAGGISNSFGSNANTKYTGLGLNEPDVNGSVVYDAYYDKYFPGGFGTLPTASDYPADYQVEVREADTIVRYVNESGWVQVSAAAGIVSGTLTRVVPTNFATVNDALNYFSLLSYAADANPVLEIASGHTLTVADQCVRVGLNLPLTIRTAGPVTVNCTSFVDTVGDGTKPLFYFNDCRLNFIFGDYTATNNDGSCRLLYVKDTDVSTYNYPTTSETLIGRDFTGAPTFNGGRGRLKVDSYGLTYFSGGGGGISNWTGQVDVGLYGWGGPGNINPGGFAVHESTGPVNVDVGGSLHVAYTGLIPTQLFIYGNTSEGFDSSLHSLQISNGGLAAYGRGYFYSNGFGRNASGSTPILTVATSTHITYAPVSINWQVQSVNNRLAAVEAFGTLELTTENITAVDTSTAVPVALVKVNPACSLTILGTGDSSVTYGTSRVVDEVGGAVTANTITAKGVIVRAG